MMIASAVVRRAWGVATAAAVFSLALPAQEKVDVPTIDRITAEEMQHSQVMDIMSWLTDVHGPRLTGSPITKMAGDWTIATMRSWGLTNPHYESWGPFGRGWTSERFSAQVVAPHPFPLIAYAGAWSTGTNGPETGDVVRVHLDSMSDLAGNRGEVRGKWVMLAPPPAVVAHFTPQGTRWTDHQLDSMAAAPMPAAGGRGGRGGRGGMAEFIAARTKFLVDEGALGVLQDGGAGGRGGGPATRDFGTVAVQATGSREPNAPPSVPTIIVSTEQYGRIWRILEKNLPVKLEVNSAVRFYDGDLNSFNIVAEIPGTDPALKDEVVMIGGHFDSWHGGTGATDNAAGSATMLEAMRLIKSLGLKPRRTIRIGLWTGEEQGLLGSRAYVKEHFGEPGKPTPANARLAAYFNVDNGTGKIRGVYEQGNAAVAPIFDAWMGPFKTVGMRTLTLSNTGGTDHLSFDAVGIPGFQFIQDPVEYPTRTHHSNEDVYERIQPEDMKFNAAVVASFAWQAAQRDAELPRKP